MRKVTIKYESDPGVEGKSHITCEGSALELLVGAAAIVCQISEIVAKSNGDEQSNVALQIFGATLDNIMHKERKSNGKNQ